MCKVSLLFNLSIPYNYMILQQGSGQDCNMVTTCCMVHVGNINDATTKSAPPNGWQNFPSHPLGGIDLSHE